jgi:hypothetical protein
VVIAGCTNLLCMRNDELWHGVMVHAAPGRSEIHKSDPIFLGTSSL